MRYTVTRQMVWVIGYIWQPGVGICAQDRALSSYDLENIGNPDSREDVEQWIVTHFGDFQSIEDFRADFHIQGSQETRGDKHIVHEWEKGEESECAYSDCMAGDWE